MSRYCNIVLDLDDSLLESISELLGSRRGSSVYRNLVCCQESGSVYMYPATIQSHLPCFIYDGVVFKPCTLRELQRRLRLYTYNDFQEDDPEDDYEEEY